MHLSSFFPKVFHLWHSSPLVILKDRTCTKVCHITLVHTSIFTKYCKENPWTINVHNPSKGNPFAGCGWHSIYWSAVVYSTSYCWDKATIMLLYKQSEQRWGGKKKIIFLNHILKALIAVAFSPAKLYEMAAWVNIEPF